MASRGADRFNVVDGIFALGHVVKTTGVLVENIKENLSTSLPEDLPMDLGRLPIAELLTSFLIENRERLEVIGTAAPGIIELLLEQLVGDDSQPVDISMDEAREWFEAMLERVIDQALGLIGNEDFDFFEFIKNFESIADVFIQEWLLPQFDRELGI